MVTPEWIRRLSKDGWIPKTERGCQGRSKFASVGRRNNASRAGFGAS
jgi:hypothetical protein